MRRGEEKERKELKKNSKTRKGKGKSCNSLLQMCIHDGTSNT